MCTKNEDPKGASTELMPSIMGAFDAIIGNTLNEGPEINPSTPRKTHQSNNFANLSPGVQKILSHVPDQELSKTFSSDETLGPKRTTYSKKTIIHRAQRSFHKSNESLDIISSNVQKMLSNLPDNELVISTTNLHVKTYQNNNNTGNSYLYSKRDCSVPKETLSPNKDDGYCINNDSKSFLHRTSSLRKTSSASGECYEGSAIESTVDGDSSGKLSEHGENGSPRPLGSYLHTSPYGIASRTPVGRKNMGKYLQVPSESSVGTTSSTASSEVSRPVSLTSLGSCSSSGSSGPHQTGSNYLASAESLDSDPEPTGSQGSADSGIAEQPTVSPEMRVLQEVLDTETVYVADLNEVIQGYLQPWKEDAECILTDHLQDLFTNVVDIYEFNKSFLEQLRKADFDPSLIANVFLQNDAGFSVYNEYCTKYPRTMDVISELTRDEKAASMFREKQMALGHALPLGSYLLKPVQRILKYHLLLQRLSKQCEPCHKPAVDLALATMTGIACGINNMKRKHEHAVRVQEIQSQLYGWPGPDLTALGELIAEGIFRMNGAKGRRHVFLFDKVFLVAKNRDSALAYKSHIMTSNLMLVEHVRGEPLSFQVLPFDNPRFTCTLRAKSHQHKREWTLQIKRVMLENYKAVIPNHARQLVLQLGQDVPETDDSNDKWSPLKQHSTPHYLERRSRARKSRNDATNRRATSQDRTFPSLGNWRRKSEPGIIAQYNTKTLPKKISKMKKAKESGSKFYTDLSDSEAGNLNGESFESLPEVDGDSIKESCDNIDNLDNREEIKKSVVNDNIEKIVSDLLMENTDFHKILQKQRRKLRDSEPNPPTWGEEERPELPAKADSLPRSFQLSEPSSSGLNGEKTVSDKSATEVLSSAAEEKLENDLSSRVADEDGHPEHKIYRNTGIRISLLHRVRAIIREQQKNSTKYPLHKQGSKSMGEKLAHPDYVDPQKLFPGSHSSSSLTLTVDLTESEDTFDNFLNEPERLDMTINEKEVLTELEKRLKQSTNSLSGQEIVQDTGQGVRCDSSLNLNAELNSTMQAAANISSSRNSNSDSYYESLLDANLVEEYVCDEHGRKVLKQDSFRSSTSEEAALRVKKIMFERPKHDSGSFGQNGEQIDKGRSVVKRPTNAPPPIPAKPSRLSNGRYTPPQICIEKWESPKKDDSVNNLQSSRNGASSSTFSETKRFSDSITNFNGTRDKTTYMSSRLSETHNRSWVKTMVGRFE